MKITLIIKNYINNLNLNTPLDFIIHRITDNYSIETFISWYQRESNNGVDLIGNNEHIMTYFNTLPNTLSTNNNLQILSTQNLLEHNNVWANNQGDDFYNQGFDLLNQGFDLYNNFNTVYTTVVGLMFGG